MPCYLYYFFIGNIILSVEGKEVEEAVPVLGLYF
jgi:hypothetical protein